MKFIGNIYTESLLLSKSLTASSLWQGCSLISFVAILLRLSFLPKKREKKKNYTVSKWLCISFVILEIFKALLTFVTYLTLVLPCVKLKSELILIFVSILFDWNQNWNLLIWCILILCWDDASFWVLFFFIFLCFKEKS